MNSSTFTKIISGRVRQKTFHTLKKKNQNSLRTSGQKSGQQSAKRLSKLFKTSYAAIKNDKEKNIDRNIQ